jgi:hypothetical protein
MSEDWRLRIDLHESGLARELIERFEASELEHGLERAFHDSVVVSRDGPEVFCYTDTREQAERVEALVRSLADEQGWQVKTELRRWHPASEEWEDPDKPLPESDTEQAAEAAALLAKEREDAAAHGYPDFEVRVQCSSHRETVAFAERLRQEGLPSVRRWKYVLIGAPDEESARALAERLRLEAPPGCAVIAEGNMRAVLEGQPPNPFAIFGGLAG